ncbi:MAG: branched-chain amino acid ABC transporter permease [Solirubrobacteraceae bacterium]
MTEFIQLLVNGLVTGAILALGAIGVSLVYSILGVVNFAQGEYLTYGAYAAVVVNVLWGGNIVLAMVAAVVAIVALSVGLEYVFWRPMRRKRAGMFTMLISSFGLALTLRGLLYVVAGADSRTYRVNALRVFVIAGIRISETELAAIVIACVSIGVLGIFLGRSRFGKAMRAVAEQPQLAAVAGIVTHRVILLTWVFVGVLAALAGVLEGLLISSFNENMGFSLLLPIFAATILGGLGNPYGALAGGLTIGVVMQLSTWSGFAGGVSPVWEQVVAFVVLLAALLIRPYGILGRKALT